MFAERLAKIVFFLCDHPHNLSSVVQILWLFIAISNCWSAIPVVRKCNRTANNTKPNVALCHMDAFPKHRSLVVPGALKLALALCLKYLNLGKAMLQEREKQLVFI